jgi:hypothetical protein
MLHKVTNNGLPVTIRHLYLKFINKALQFHKNDLSIGLAAIA